MSEDKPKRDFEAAINRVTREIANAVRVTEKVGAHLTDEQVRKAWQYLGVVLANALQPALLARQAGGGFSLAGEMQMQTQQIAPQPPAAANPMPIDINYGRAKTPQQLQKPRLEGRIVGTKQPVFTLEPEQKAPPEPESPGERPDRHGFIAEAGFLDE